MRKKTCLKTLGSQCISHSKENTLTNHQRWHCHPASSGHPASARFPKAGWPSNHGNLVSKPEVVLFNWRKKSKKPLLIRLLIQYTKVNIKDFSGRRKSGSNETEVMEYSWLLCTHLCPLAIQRHSNPSCSRPEHEKCGRLAAGMSMLASVINIAKWILYNKIIFIAPWLVETRLGYLWPSLNPCPQIKHWPKERIANG